MQELAIFENAEFGQVRTRLDERGDIWFVGKDICKALGYTNSNKAIADHVDEEDKLNNESLSSLGQRGGWLINESGMYSLILRSRLEKAKLFKRWLTSEVIPSIRKTGQYSLPNQPTQTQARLEDFQDEKLLQDSNKIEFVDYLEKAGILKGFMRACAKLLKGKARTDLENISQFISEACIIERVPPLGQKYNTRYSVSEFTAVCNYWLSKQHKENIHYSSKRITSILKERNILTKKSSSMYYIGILIKNEILEDYEAELQQLALGQ